jgi:putative membrane protein (TIGR04086 family)
MSFNLSSIKWGWVVLGVVIASVISYGSSICVVTGYASYLAFQARGAPDQVMISEFAASNAEGVMLTLVGVGALVGGLVAGRKAKVDAIQNGLVVGLLTALLCLILSFLSGFSLWTIVGVVLSIVGGWLGGKLAVRGV